MRHFPVSPGGVNTIERVYLIERTNNEKGKGGEVHNIQKLSERHQKKGAYKWGAHLTSPLFVMQSRLLV
jgi:hypothetical protein